MEKHLAEMDDEMQGWQKTRKFEKARKSPGFFKKPGLYLGLFQIPGFFKNAMFERKTALLKLDVLYCIIECFNFAARNKYILKWQWCNFIQYYNFILHG